MKTLVLTRLQMYAKIHVFFLAYCALGLGIIQWRSVKSPPSFVGAVPDGLHPGDGPSSIWEHFRPGPQEQLGSLLDIWVPLQRHSEGT